ncbi:MAG TPA: DNA polymerase III subunit gamma/tau [Candidatus Hydrogenedentes bacterium]|nr:DNA polymerase III subunit gamma/tau [Candidatus Hydrogenedentota bacterium]
MAKDPYLVLARKWRPQRFEDVVGQEHITRALQNAISSGRIGHAFLFIGSRGIGKTTTARILAKALNCEEAKGPTPTPCGECDNCRTIASGSNIDVLEIDGASNNTVDDVRQLRENIRLIPSRSRKKIYIIDEVHQLSQSAFNALLKTLEEPPEHAVFILATTETHKVPATIISRCQRYDFRRAGMESLRQLLRQILETEKITCSDEAVYAIARAADGGIRDAESILEQLISYCGKNITYKDVFDVLGLVDWKLLHTLCGALQKQDIATVLGTVEDIVASGKDLSQFVQDILQYFRNLMVCKTSAPRTLLALPDDEVAEMEEIAESFSLTQLIKLVEQFAELAKDFDSQLAQRIALESLLIRLSKISVDVSIDSVLEKLSALGSGGMPTPPSGSPSPRRSTPALEPSSSNGADEPIADAARPARPRKATVTSENMARVWQYLSQVASESSMNLGVALGHAVPVSLVDGELLVRFAAQWTRSRALVERQENLELVSRIIKDITHNVTSVRLDSAFEEVESEVADIRPLRHIHGSVNAEEAKAAMGDPHVARVVDVFRGRIVDIKRGTGQAEG